MAHLRLQGRNGLFERIDQGGDPAGPFAAMMLRPATV
jgi:hypothetical protein